VAGERTPATRGTGTSEQQHPAPQNGFAPVQRVRWSTVIAYGIPGLGAGYMYLMLSLYVMKFSTDVLLIAPAIMGLIVSASRIWDAISDPIAGYLSDRTRNRYGRRRSWILASTLPIAAADPARLPDGGASWGAYYEQEPMVMAGKIALGLAAGRRA